MNDQSRSAKRYLIATADDDELLRMADQPQDWPRNTVMQIIRARGLEGELAERRAS